MTDLNALRAANAARWPKARPTRSAEALAVGKRLVAAKSRYQAVEKRTGVPWWFVAAVHEREASQNWNTQLGQGDALDRVSEHVPAGRGPFKTWEDGAVDALVNCAPFAARNKDWSIGGSLSMWEQYNGLKYFYADRPSPYPWAGTSIYDPPSGPGGKVLRDHGPIEDVVDKQLGCAAMLMAMMALDPTITFTGATITPIAPKPVLVPKPITAPPATPEPAKGSIWSVIASILSAIFIKPKGK